MKMGTIIGLILLIGGIIIYALYSIFTSLQTINIATLPLLVLIAGATIVIGIIVLLISIIFEQKKDMDKRKEEIKKEDFEP